jgi:Protein of unknown function (DUF3320)
MVRAEEKWRKMDVLLRPSNVARLAELIVVIVGAEGPIHEEVIIDRLKQIYEIDRISANSTTAVNITRAIGLAVGDRRLQRCQNRSFLSVTGATRTHFRLPNDGVERSIDMIAPEEIELAVLHLIEDQFGMKRDRVPHAVAHLLGIKQLRAEGATLIGQLVDGLIDRGVLRASGFQVYLA